jgi:carboxyl-terminal processing protease
MNGPLPTRRFFPLGLLLVTTFLLGVFIDRSGWLPGSGDREPPGLGRTFTPFWEAWNLVQEHYVDQKSAQPVKMTRYAIAGMLESLGDEGHTTYLAPDDVKRMESGLKGELEGIGARITMRKRIPTIFATMPNSPARKAGVKAGDAILEVNGQSVVRESLQQIVQQVRGEAGTEVKLRVMHEGQTGPVEVAITRGKIEVPDVSWHMLPGQSFAHIGVESFGDKADEQLRAALKEAREQGAKGVILDLRGNPGGLKDQAVAVTSEFLKDGNVFIDQDAHGKQTPVPVKPDGTAVDVPLCVLIDGGTASAAEICAGALQDYDRAKLVGERTFGTGTVLQPFPLSDGSAVLLATSQWLTPKGRQIWHKGIAPDVEVALPEGASILLPEMEDGMDAAGFKRSEDAQLHRALEILQKQIQSPAPEGK